MPLFKLSKKTSEQLRTLSEKEIQEKLYGKFRKSLDGKSLEADSAAFSAKDFTGPALIAEEDSESGNDLFSPSSNDTSFQHSAAKKSPALESQPKKEIKPEILRPSYERRDKIKESISSLGTPKPAFKTQKPQTSFSYRQHTTQAAGWIQTLGKLLLEGATLVARGAAAIIQWFDLRRFRNRTISYWIGSLFFLAVLLGGIHYLNVKREAAMKTPRHRPPAASLPKSSNASPSQQSAVKRIAVPAAGPLSKAESAANEQSGTASDLAGESSAEGLFVIQIATYASEADAQELLTKIKETELPSFVKEFTRLGGKTYYTVFIGRFKTYQQAQIAISKFQKKEMAKPFQDAFIRTLKLSTE